jgi:hypothetical protein
MVSAVPQQDTPAGEPAVTTDTPHWLTGIYFVPQPDLSDECRAMIRQGRAELVEKTIWRLLRDLERRGTKQQRAAAKAGRIEHLGVQGIAAEIGSSRTDGKPMSPRAVLRQLRALESIGLIRTEQAAFSLEVDPTTGRIVRNYARQPPKIIVVTLQERHLRPAAAGGRRQSQRRPDDTEVGRQRRPRGDDRRAPKARVSQRETSTEVSPPERQGGQRTGPSGGPVAAATDTTADRERQSRLRLLDTWIVNVAKLLRIDRQEVIELGKADRAALLTRIEAAGGDPATGRRRHGAGRHAPAPASQEEEGRSNAGREVRPLAAATPAPPAGAGAGTRETGDDRPDPVRHALSPDREDRHHGPTRPVSDPGCRGVAAAGRQGPAGAAGPPDRDGAAAGLVDALTAMTTEGRDRAAELGERMAELDDEAAALLAVIERKRQAQEAAGPPPAPRRSSRSAVPV